MFVAAEATRIVEEMVQKLPWNDMIFGCDLTRH